MPHQTTTKQTKHYNMKEKILATFSNLGFIMTPTNDEKVYRFSYEGVNLLYLYNETDEDFLSIAVPGIMEVTDSNMMYVLLLMEKINNSLKYIKSYLVNDEIWLFYEHELFGGEDFMNVIPAMIIQLERALQHSRRLMYAVAEELKDGSDDNSDSDGDNHSDVDVTENTDSQNDDE